MSVIVSSGQDQNIRRIVNEIAPLENCRYYFADNAEQCINKFTDIIADVFIAELPDNINTTDDTKVFIHDIKQSYKTSIIIAVPLNKAFLADYALTLGIFDIIFMPVRKENLNRIIHRAIREKNIETSIKKRLNDEKNRIKDLFNHTQAGIAVIKYSAQDPDYLKIIETNDLVVKWLKIDKNDSPIGLNFLDLAENLGEHVINGIMSVLKNGESTSLNIFNKFNGQYVNVNVYSPMKNLCVLVFHDQTDRKKVESEMKEMQFRLRRQNIMLDDKIQELKQTRNTLEMIIEGSSDGIWDYDFQQDKLWVSPQYKAFLGYNPNDQFVERLSDFRNMIYADDIDIFDKAVNEVKNRQRTKINGELRTICKDGTHKWVSIRASVTEDNKENNILHMAGIISDIQQRKNYEETVKKQNEELQKAIETKNMFISIIAHDLRNPFNAILGLSDLLKRRFAESRDIRSIEIINIIFQSAQNTFEMLNNLLIWARSQQNIIQFEPEIVDVYKMVNETINEVRGQADKKRILLVNQTIAGDIVYADRQMIQTIIRNLAGNSIKFTKENGCVAIGCQDNGAETVITVEDNGKGMNQETVDKLLSASKSQSTTGTNGEMGSGMGLLICKEFISKHNGKLDIESYPDKGSKFIITFPGQPKKS